MSRNAISSGGARERTWVWPLEVEVEICPAARREVTAGRLRSLTTLLNEADGVRLATAEVHGQANLIRVRLAVDGRDLNEAFDRVSELVRGCVARAGLGCAVLVAVRCAALDAAATRSG